MIIQGKEWSIKTLKFDCGLKWGVAIERMGESGAMIRQALLIPDGSLSEEEAIERAIPVFEEWASA